MPELPATITGLWVTEDGTHGVSNLLLVDTSKWTEADWEEFEDASDWTRQDTALAIADRKGSDWQYA